VSGIIAKWGEGDVVLCTLTGGPPERDGLRRFGGAIESLRSIAPNGRICRGPLAGDLDEARARARKLLASPGEASGAGEAAELRSRTLGSRLARGVEGRGGGMKNREVPREEWPKFFEELERRHRNARVTVRVLHPELGSQVEARDLPLTGVAFDPTGRGSIEVLLGGRPGTNLEHDVPAPQRVLAELSDDGTEVALDIQSEGGVQTLLEFAASRVEA
jgi:uncharacterized protein DUF5335